MLCVQKQQSKSSSREGPFTQLVSPRVYQAYSLGFTHKEWSHKHYVHNTGAGSREGDSIHNNFTVAVMNNNIFLVLAEQHFNKQQWWSEGKELWLHTSRFQRETNTCVFSELNSNQLTKKV